MGNKNKPPVKAENQQITFEEGEDGKLVVSVNSEDFPENGRDVRVAAVLQTISIGQFLSNIFGSNKDAVKGSVAIVNAMKPQDETEMLLAAQMAAAHMMSMEFSKRAIYPDQDVEISNYLTNRSVKLMRVFMDQMNTLQKYRGKDGKPKVENVNVNEGGQAIVGDVHQHGEKKP